ncbi:PIN domain-containing protein [Peterkaempfera bronchialis]|uniref:NTP pyrophosphohydrolase n=1 Tax=Peterkaempfera bronchialis TaxID=2126346 RepID=A0A345T1M8_9ACTN|nr:NTP pyrophosphohydrolase [Peterkaempfera bronchialis]AXI79883.1 NTP pyrophosphohydrolase [Peterkaempfera bronchialis]
MESPGRPPHGAAQEPRPLLIVDGANVVGSVPDGWWRDRRGAAERLRDALVAVAADGLPEGSGAPEWACGGPLEVLLVVEGAARGVAEVPGVRVASATGSGDDLVVRLTATERAENGTAPRRCLVVTADRELRARVTTLGAEVTGPRAVRPR